MKNKNNHRLPTADSHVEDEEKERLSLAVCRKILKDEGDHLPEEDLLMIRDYFYRLAALTLEQYQYQTSKEAPVITLEHHKTNADEESYYLRAG